jgi:hypothetical protein
MPGHPGPAFGRPEGEFVPGIHAFIATKRKDVNGGDEPGHDDRCAEKAHLQLNLGALDRAAAVPSNPAQDRDSGGEG